jgi:hypothetical protein
MPGAREVMGPMWKQAPFRQLNICAVLAACPGLGGTEVQAKDPRAARWYRDAPAPGYPEHQVHQAVTGPAVPELLVALHATAGTCCA